MPAIPAGTPLCQRRDGARTSDDHPRGIRRAASRGLKRLRTPDLGVTEWLYGHSPSGKTRDHSGGREPLSEHGADRENHAQNSSHTGQAAVCIRGSGRYPGIPRLRSCSGVFTIREVAEELKRFEIPIRRLTGGKSIREEPPAIAGWLLLYMVALAFLVVHGIGLTIGAIVIYSNPSIAGLHTFITARCTSVLRDQQT